MTLQQWNNNLRIVDGVHKTEDGRTFVIADTTLPNYHDLWKLEDSRVETVSCGVVYFAPKS